MRNLIILLTLFGAAFCDPNWFYNINAKPYETIGYGSGKSAKEAENRALESLAATLNSEVRSRFDSRTKASGDEYNKTTDAELIVRTNARLSGVELMLIERHGDEFFAAVKLDMRPIETRLLERLGAAKCAKNGGEKSVGEKGGKFVRNSPFAASLKAKAGCEVAFNLWRQNDLWFVGNNNAAIVWNEESLSRLFSSKTDRAIGINLSKATLKPNESFTIAIDSRKKGFISLFDLYDTGEIALMAGNLPIDANQTMVIPDAIDANLGLFAAETSREAAQDFYIAVFSAKPIDVAYFEKTSDRLITSSDQTPLELLIKLLDQYKYSVAIATTRK